MLWCCCWSLDLGRLKHTHTDTHTHTLQWHLGRREQSSPQGTLSLCNSIIFLALRLGASTHMVRSKLSTVFSPLLWMSPVQCHWYHWDTSGFGFDSWDSSGRCWSAHVETLLNMTLLTEDNVWAPSRVTQLALKLTKEEASAAGVSVDIQT